MNIKKILYNALKETFKHLNYSEDDISHFLSFCR